MVVFFFFFQAEDGIRDLVRSRGLGDVYKRQMKYILDERRRELAFEDHRFWDIRRLKIGEVVTTINKMEITTLGGITTVSYTHLTLPTSDLV